MAHPRRPCRPRWRPAWKRRRTILNSWQSRVPRRWRSISTRFRTNEPIQGAAIDIDAGGETLKAEPSGDGVYVVKPKWSGTPGSYDLAFTVQAGDLIDILTGTLVIPPPAAKPAPPAPLLGGFIPPRLRGRLAQAACRRGFRSLGSCGAARFWRAFSWRCCSAGGRPAAAAMLARRSPLLNHPAEAASTADNAPVVVRDLAQRLPDGTIFVPKSTQRVLAIRTLFTEEQNHPGTVELPARVIPDPNASGYVQSSMGGRLMPPEGGFPRLGTRVEAGQVLASVMPVIGAADLTSQQAQLREVEQEISLIETKLKRYAKLKDVVSTSAVEDAELELAGLRARKEVLATVTAEPEKLVAPVSGVIAAVNAVAGQIAEPSAVIFQIIDPTRYWVEALSYQALPITGAGEGRLADGACLRSAIGARALPTGTRPFPCTSRSRAMRGMLRAGQLLTVLAHTQAERKGIAVPRTAVIRGANGQPIVYEHINAENFRPARGAGRAARWRARADRLRRRAGQRIVTQGAELLNQIR